MISVVEVCVSTKRVEMPSSSTSLVLLSVHLDREAEAVVILGVVSSSLRRTTHLGLKIARLRTCTVFLLSLIVDKNRFGYPLSEYATQR